MRMVARPHRRAAIIALDHGAGGHTPLLIPANQQRHLGGAEGTAGPIVRDLCIANGLMVRGIRDPIVMCPPLIITTEQIDELIGKIRLALDAAESKLRAIQNG